MYFRSHPPISLNRFTFNIKAFIDYEFLNSLFTDLPKFGERLQNITVPVGRDAVLICVVDNLQTYKVQISFFFLYFFVISLPDILSK